MATQKQIDANRANALNSTGPQTPAGKAAVRLNALKHGLTARDAVLPFEDQDQFDEIAKAYEEHYKPIGPVEILLVQQIVMAAWRLCRVRGMETAALELRLAEHAPAPASNNDSAKQSQIAPDPLPQKDLTPPSPQSPNLQITQSPNHRPAADQSRRCILAAVGLHELPAGALDAR